jgi:hypothetical protein
MSACIDTDVIAPKYSATTIISKCNAIPTTTTLAFSATEVSCNLSTWAVGNGTNLFVSLSIPTLNFTGDGTAVTCNAITGLTAPAASIVNTPCVVVMGGTTQDGLIALHQNKTIFIYSSAAGGSFTGSAVCKIYPTVVTYSTY